MNKKNTILLADDDFDLREQLRMQLIKMGHNVVAVETEADAKQQIENNNFDLAVFDLMMEHQDSGFILAHKVKSKNPKTPVIIISAVTKQTGMPFTLDRNWIKADAFLQKDIRFEQLDGEIKRLLK